MRGRRALGALAGFVVLGAGLPPTHSAFSAVSSAPGSSFQAAVGGGFAPPRSVAPPAVTGRSSVGAGLVASAGAWANEPAGYAYRWRRCDPAGLGCVDIPGATGATYAVQDADAGSTLRMAVTATNARGSSTASSLPTAVVDRPATATRAPTLSGVAQQGQTLTGDAGDWTGATGPRSLAWLRCDEQGDACRAIPGASATSYTLTGDDVGTRLRFQVTTGATVVASAPSTVVVALAVPRSLTAPTLAGLPYPDQALTAAPGTWSGATEPSGYAWERCDAGGAACATIVGATGPSLRLGGADLGATIRVRVTATNAGGSATARSAPAGPIAPAPAPTSTRAPAIQGSALQGQTLSADEGAWSSPLPLTFTRQWSRCDAWGNGCSAVPGATGSTYRLSAGDIGRTIRCAATATNTDAARRSTTATSPASAVVRGTYAAAIAADAPYYHFRLGDPPGSRSAADTTSNGPAAVSGTVGFGAAGLFADDAAASFDGSGGILQAGSGPANSGALTVEAWVRTQARDGFRGVAVKQNAYGLFLNGGVASAYSWGPKVEAWSGVDVADGQWHLLALVVGGGRQQLYVDGTARASTAWTATGWTEPFVIGSGAGGTSTWRTRQAFSGVVDEVAVYPRALSAGQVAAHWAASR